MAGATRVGLGPIRWVAVLLFAYVLARPVSTNTVLVPVLAAMGVLAAGTIVVKARRLARPLVPALLITFVFGVVGLLAGPTNPGFVGGLLVFIAAPLLYWMITVAVDERLLRAAFYAAAIVTVFIGGTIALYVAGNTGTLPAVLPHWLLEQTGAGFSAAAYTEVRYYGLSTLVATGPMWVASLFVGRDELLPPQWLRVVAAAAATVGTLSGGRRALALVLVLAPLLAWMIKTLVARRNRRTKADARVVIGGVGALLVLVLAAPGAFSADVISSAWRSVTGYIGGDDFTGTNVAADKIRAYQADRLLDEWADSPIFGHGFGATIQGYARSANEPWRWELQYHAILFWTGVVGALLVVVGFLFTLNAVVLAARARPQLAPSLIVACTAAAAMLIANATNPYLQAPGHVWAIFLPVAVANVMLLSRKPDPVPETASPPASAA